MKVTFLCPSISRTSGGIFEIERKLAQALSRLPVTYLEVLGLSDEHTSADLPAWEPLQPRHFGYLGPSSFRYSAKLQGALLASDADLVHLHALWMHNSIVLRKWAQRRNRPYIITANGMLDEWAVRNSGWKKRIALAVYERACLNGAACIQVNSEAEYRSARRFGLRNPICIIPNGVDLPENTNGEANTALERTWKGLIPSSCRVLLYLGRLHPKKGLANLLKAWAQVNATSRRTPEWVLAIAGWDQSGHQADLQALASKLNSRQSVLFLGPQFGTDKIACYRRCDAFILPSQSEGQPMSVLEAWSHAKPVCMTQECNLVEGFAAGAALSIEPTVDSIEDGLRSLFEMPVSKQQAMGQRGLELVRNHFAWPRIAAEMRSVYNWTLGSGPKPVCVME